MRTFAFWLLTLSGALSLTVQAQTQVQQNLKPYDLTYTAKYTLILPFRGEATRNLKQLEDGSWQLSHKVDSKLAKIRETSIFDWQDNHVLPLSYRFSQKTIGKDRELNIDFDYSTQMADAISHKDKPAYPLVAGGMDKLNYQLQMRYDLMDTGLASEYMVADRDNFDPVEYELAGEEIIKTPAGEFDTLKVHRVREDEEKRDTMVWLARDWDYLVVRIEQTEKGKTYRIELKEGELDGVPVRGLSTP